jgi:hypothetical protein
MHVYKNMVLLRDDDRHAIWLDPPVMCDVIRLAFSNSITSHYTTPSKRIPRIRSSIVLQQPLL